MNYELGFALLTKLSLLRVAGMISLLLAGSALVIGSNMTYGASLMGLHTWGTNADDG